MNDDSPYIGIGLLDGLMMEYVNVKEDPMDKGYDLIPDKLRLRWMTRDDVETISHWEYVRPDPFKYSVGKKVVLEVKGPSVDYVDGAGSDLMRHALLAFRLLKEGSIYIEGIYGFPSGPSGVKSFNRMFNPVKPAANFRIYTFDPEEIPDLIHTLDIVRSIDFDKNPAHRIACERLGKRYEDFTEDDILIDLCIAYEALFLKGEYQKSELGMGQVIGLACSMLIGKDKAERTDIKNNIESGFNLRNKVVHGYEIDANRRKRIKEILPDFENNLRRSILRLIL
jgi:hypothetical protein